MFDLVYRVFVQASSCTALDLDKTKEAKDIRKLMDASTDLQKKIDAVMDEPDFESRVEARVKADLEALLTDLKAACNE